MEMLANAAAAMTRLDRAGLIVLLGVPHDAESTAQSLLPHRQDWQEEPSERGSWRSWGRSRQARGLSGGGVVRASVVRADRAALRAAQVNSAESGHQ